MGRRRVSRGATVSGAEDEDADRPVATHRGNSAQLLHAINGQIKPKAIRTTFTFDIRHQSVHNQDDTVDGQERDMG